MQPQKKGGGRGISDSDYGEQNQISSADFLQGRKTTLYFLFVFVPELSLNLVRFTFFALFIKSRTVPQITCEHKKADSL